MLICEWCRGPIAITARSDTKTCGDPCRQAKHRFRVGVAPTSRLSVAEGSSATLQRDRQMTFGYADPPYPGMAKRYYGATSEVNHRILVGTLERTFPDGWALSTSSHALQSVLALCPPGARVCPWIKGRRASKAKRAHNSWEPLIVVRGREGLVTAADKLSDTLLWGGRQHSYPGALIGMKPAAFCEWMFRLLGANQGDTLVDIFPGSGAVSRAWDLHMLRAAASSQPRLSEAQNRLSKQLNSRCGGTEDLTFSPETISKNRK